MKMLKTIEDQALKARVGSKPNFSGVLSQAGGSAIASDCG